MSAADDFEPLTDADSRMSGVDRHVSEIEAKWAKQRQAEEAGRKFAEELLAQDEAVLSSALYNIASENVRVYTKAQFGPNHEARQIEDRVDRFRVEHLAKQAWAQELRGDIGSDVFMLGGGAFIHDLPAELPCLWGTGSAVAWASGEALMLVGTPGVGKTTIAGQVLRARLVGGEVLGMEVAKTERRVLYLAMDRPKQIARALARQLRDVPRDVLDAHLVVWPGPPEKDIAVHPELMLKMAHDADADTVFVDSLKDAALGLSNDEVGAGYNRARQNCLANGVEVFELHHMKKNGSSSSGNQTKPTKLEDVYGSAWITAGAGSVVLLVGDAGDSVVEWRHLKQPAEPVGPLVIEHDHNTGTSSVYDGTDPYEFIRKAGEEGITVRDFCDKWLGTPDPSTPAGKNAIAKARRKLESYVRSGYVECVDKGDKATSRPARYAVLTSPLGGPEVDFSETDVL